MKLAVITDSSAYLSDESRGHDNLFVLDIPVVIDGVSYVEGKNLTAEEFYQKMEASSELPKTSQPSIAELEELLSQLEAKGYTHVLGIFLSSGISGFYQNIQYMKDEFPNFTIAFPDSKITSAPLGWMAIDGTSAYIMVDDLNHLVKGGRLSNGAAILGNLLSIKPILYFNEEGVIEVYEKVRTEKKAINRLAEIVKGGTADKDYQIIIIHGNALDKAETLRDILHQNGFAGEIPFATFGSVIGTHLGNHSVAISFVPKV